VIDMAGIWLTVCLPASAGGDEAAAAVRNAVAAAMEPFDMNGDNPVDRTLWDHWTIRGGHDGAGFAVVDGHWDDPRLVHDMPHFSGTPRPSVPGVCAGGPRALLDLARPHLANERARGATWDLWQELRATLPAARPLAEFVQEWWNDKSAGTGDRYGDAMFAAYRRQPLIEALLDHPHSGPSGFLGFPHPREHPVIGFQGSREDFVAPDDPRPARRLGHHVLTPDGWWYEPRGQVVHGSCDPHACPHQEPDLGEDTDGYLASLPADMVLVRLHCHG
jgi:hypothetical protein